jgi:enoyl-CoA hydratase
MAYENILTDSRDGIGVITINRPKVLNALTRETLREIASALEEWDADTAHRCAFVTGSEKAFAAGADVKEMAGKSYQQMYAENYLGHECDRIAAIRKPVFAAVAGFALGGGCELAMLLDFILAADTAKFGQPEITLGILPGMGGSQRLTKSVGKSKAMEMCLTGRMIDASEALACGLVARVVPAAELLDEAMKTARKIAAQPIPAAMMVKESVGRALESGLSEGVRFERRLFHAVFATEDQKEGMAAFGEKRKPEFKDR